MIIRDSKQVSEQTSQLYLRHRYRSHFKLTAAEMEAEPLADIALALSIWEAQAERDKLEQKRSERKSKHGNAQ